MLKCCTLYSGSSGNSLFVQSKESKILIDAGVSGKKIEEALLSVGTSIHEIDGILITHEHSDHVLSVGTLSKKYNIPLFASENTWKGLESQIAKINSDNIFHLKTDTFFNIKDIEILPFKIPHDAYEPCGFSIFSQQKKITIATDIGHMNRYLLSHFENSDLLILESNHDVAMLKCGRYPWNLKQRILGDTGHLSNEMAGKTISYLAQNGMKKFLLGHLSSENNFPELAYQTVLSCLNEKGISAGKDVFLEVAPRNSCSEMLEFA